MKTIVRYLFAIALLCPFVQAMAQEMNDDEKKQLSWLLSLDGNWYADAATIKTGGNTATFKYYADFKKLPASNSLVMHEWGDIPGIGKFDGQNLAGVDPFDGKIHWFSVNNLGDAHVHIGAYTDERHLTIVHNGMRNGKEYIEKVNMVMDSTDKNKLTFMVVATLGGEEQFEIQGTFVRKKS